MDNQNIYSQKKHRYNNRDWYTGINLAALHRTGIFNYPELVPFYLLLFFDAEDTKNAKVGEFGNAFFGKDYIMEYMGIGPRKYAEIRNKLVELGFAKIVQMGTAHNTGTILKLIHFADLKKYPGKFKKNNNYETNINNRNE